MTEYIKFHPSSELVEAVSRLLALKADVSTRCHRFPTHALLPTRLMEEPRPDSLSLYGLPVIWTDEDVEPSLVYSWTNP